MCGISGFCDFKTDFSQDAEKWTDILIQMRRAIAHRGSDQTGEYLRANAGLSHTRLSIRDLAGGTQPMVRQAKGAEYAIVYNGEIYNADELKAGLERAGFSFKTNCDTEVILCAYMAYGADFVTKLNGIFAFAVWDGAHEELLLYRDRLGVKPLFFAQRESALVFGSEIKALFRHPAVRPEIDVDSFREIFGIGPARTPGCGVFRGVSEIKPGHFAVFSRDGFREAPYWSLTADIHPDSYAETVAKVSFLVRDAITRQMVSDVPVCALLSGGIDSSIVTAVASNYLRERGAYLGTFSFDFAGNDENFRANAFQPERDRPYVEKMLAAYTLDHRYLECGDDALVASLHPAMLAKDLPGMTDVDGSLLYFCALVREHDKVVLTGECADEIFGGYPWFYREDLLCADGFPWSFDLSPRTALLTDTFTEQLSLEDYVRARYDAALRAVPHLDGENATQRRRREVSCLNLRWFMQTLLDRMDRTSMACALEARVPFADHRIVEYLFNVPWEMKYRPGEEKALLRDACGDLLPSALLHRKKSPYPKTYSPLYEKLLAERFQNMLDDPGAPAAALIDRKKAARFLASPKDYGKPWFGQLMAAPQMLAYLLQVNDWLKSYAPVFIP